jgi:hypothetical protein
VVTSTVVINSLGQRKVTGTKALKSTQQYPEGFGAAVAAYARRRMHGADDVSESSSGTTTFDRHDLPQVR